jgi:hypothetical protein
LFANAYTSGDRVRVRFGTGEDAEELTGTIGRTTGWRPCYLLMRRSSDTGSVYTIGLDDRIVAVKRGREYVQTYFGRAS